MARTRDPRRPRQILDAALVLFGERGYHHTQIADIAAALEIGHGTVYRYFENKRDLFEQLLTETLARFAQALQTADPSAATTREEYEHQLRLIGETLQDVFTENPESLRLVVQAENLDLEMNLRFRAAMSAFAQVSAARLRNGVERGFLRADLEIDATAELTVALTIEAIRRSVEGPHDAGRHERYLKAVTTLIMQGIAAP